MLLNLDQDLHSGDYELKHGLLSFLVKIARTVQSIWSRAGEKVFCNISRLHCLVQLKNKLKILDGFIACSPWLVPLSLLLYLSKSNDTLPPQFHRVTGD